MRIAYRGNFRPSHSTETHVAASIEALGHGVVRIQEDETDWVRTVEYVRRSECDLFLWTQTYGYEHIWPDGDAEYALAQFRHMGLRSVGFHLDRWWNLDREPQIFDEAFFRCDVVVTADGDNDQRWRDAGVNHVWSPPAVYGPDCGFGTARAAYRSDVAFVGNHTWYHAEWWPQRQALLNHLRRRWRARFWPRGRAVRGQDLNDLYASVKIIIGDSCFADRSERYWSDRAFETVGRGGFLLMPRIGGLCAMLTEGEHCDYWTGFGELDAKIAAYLADDETRNRIRAAGVDHVRAEHTYERRLAHVLEMVCSR